MEIGYKYVVAGGETSAAVLIDMLKLGDGVWRWE